MNMPAIDTLLEKPLQLMAELLKDVDKVALLDYPEYANVGDSMIWLGQIELLRRLGKKVVYVCAISNYAEREVGAAVASGAALLISGGGNFGTLWPHHQQFRERVMRTFPDALIIQMPQSICFKDDAALARTRNAIANCRNFHLIVRDYPSLAFARENFPGSIWLSPDSAFFLENLRAAPAVHDIVYLRRSDKEAATNDITEARADIKIADWRSEWLHEKLLQRILRNALRFRLLRNSQRITIALYNALAKIRMQRGVQLIASGKQVITDRLHAHVLSVLLNRPNYILDNSNGKVFAFYEAWTRDLGLSQRANSLLEALRMARTISSFALPIVQFFLLDDSPVLFAIDFV